MKKRRLILITVILIFFILTTMIYKYNQSNNLKLTSQENKEIISLVESYFDNLMNKDYKEALEMVDLSKEDYSNDIEILNNRKGYTIQQANDGYWTTSCNGGDDCIIYDKEAKAFAVDTVVKIIYQGKIYPENEIVYVKRIGKKGFKISSIHTPMKPYEDCSYMIND